jgi:hypothetical protein
MDTNCATLPAVWIYAMQIIAESTIVKWQNIIYIAEAGIKSLIFYLSRNIPAPPAYGVYISQLMRYSSGCAQYSDVLGRTQPQTQKLLKQSYVAKKPTFERQ